MRTVSADTTAAWQAAYKGGNVRPCVRATIQRLHVAFTQYDLAALPDDERKGTGTFASMAFGQVSVPKELPNIRSLTWNRTLDADTAEMTLTLWNTTRLPVGESPAPGFEADFDQPGYYTFDKGKPEAIARWGEGVSNVSWKNTLIPDRVIRTFEGYGHDPDVIPELDPHLYQSGTWIIDEVDYSHDGIIVIRARDYASVLLSQIMFPPIVPWAEYPLQWEKYHTVTDPDTVATASSVTAGSRWFRPTYQTDSNKPYIGTGISDGGRAYVDANGGVLGHTGRQAMDASTSTYWLSVGNMPSWSSAFEYVQGGFSPRTIASVKVKTWGGPYTCYVSVKVDGKWKGTGKIPYGSRMIDTNADINYVKRKRVEKGAVTEIKLPKAYANATAVRLTFTDLYNSGIGYYKWRAGVKDFQVLSTASTDTTTTVTHHSHTAGNYTDFSDIVLWLLSWSGFFWPAGSQSFLTYSNGEKITVTAPSPRYTDILPKGRLWGDWMPTGTHGIKLGVEAWDKKPVMDGIRFIKDIVGFHFWVDETGGAVWRLPNVYTAGNYLSGVDGGQYANRTSSVITIDETTTLMSLRAVLSGRSIRERVFIAEASGKYGAITRGYSPANSGLRRVGGWTDALFTTTEECQIMADLIAIRQMFEYRTDTLTIAANPAIQIDDQVRIYERTTSETYLHYVKSIACELDMVTGKWTYTLGTNWLGDNPGEWAFNRANLSADTQAYLATLGAI